MIIHGRQQILPPNVIIGRTQIRFACIGGRYILGWLSDAAVAAILAAFGVDGTAVIAATNEYLNGIAASDKAKATALAGFINEDPMMVCSLGLEPTLTTLQSMPRRYLVSAGNSTITMAITFNTLSDTLYANYYRTNGGNHYDQLFGVFNNLAIHCYWWRAGYNRDYYATTANDPTYGGAPANVELESYISKDNRWLKSSGVIRAQQTTSYTTSQDKTSITLFTDDGSYYYTGGLGVIEIDGAHKHLLVPIVHDNVPTMVDGFTENSYGTRSGSFTIAYKIYQNGSWVTWTPPTP